MSDPNPGVEVHRLLVASPQRVFAAFAEQGLVAQWLRPSPDVRLSVLAFDFRPGGAYRFAYDVPEGRRMIVGGTFRAIEAPSRIVFSWLIEPPDEHAGIDSEVTVLLVPRGSSTELTIRHAQLGRADAERRHDQGWRGALDLLEARLRQHQGVPDAD
ncbi:MAG TPA: SRPBCC domain-containing protein [Polyangiaceae bacterium]|nr:SRPBCC domain-containing protein [Polyangiaceae bacterium]